MRPDPELLASLPPLVRAAALGDSRAVETLLASSDANEADDTGWTALHAAAVFDHHRIVERLLAAGAEVNARDTGGFTPLLSAARASPPVLRALLAAGADPDAVAGIGWRPIDRLAEYGNAAGLRVLLGATRRSVDDRSSEDSTTPLMTAAEAGSLECVELLLRAGADPSLTCDGKTAADLATKHGHTDVAARLSAETGAIRPGSPRLG